jgi:transcriptional/translational regulatory protein YebC/TACO1
MSGHSKWHNIQKQWRGGCQACAGFHENRPRDDRGGYRGRQRDPVNYSACGNVITKAKAANMPNDNIKRG